MKGVMPKARSKQLAALEKGRSIANSIKFRGKSPKEVLEKEFNNTKVLLKYFPYKEVVKRTGRGENTILRIKKAANYLDYKDIVAIEVSKRKMDDTSRRIIAAGRRMANTGASLPTPSNEALHKMIIARDMSHGDTVRQVISLKSEVRYVKFLFWVIILTMAIVTLLTN